MQRMFCFFISVFLLSMVLFAADKRFARISGKVVDAQGNPLKGVPVGVVRFSKIRKDAKTVEAELVVKTEADGSFAIRVDRRYEGLDAVYVFTLSRSHKNQIYEKVEFKGTSPDVDSFGNAKRLDLSKNDVEVKFVLNALMRPKQSFMVEMRDGIKLATDVYLPASGGEKEKYPALLV
ncbi:MAG: hypothetical protein N2234_10295, partial [Planctomycetota bacterium]|nr:hypothetical protein [Planctomycetota bacterium]